MALIWSGADTCILHPDWHPDWQMEIHRGGSCGIGQAVGATFEKYNAHQAFAIERSGATSMLLIGDMCLVFIPEILRMGHVTNYFPDTDPGVSQGHFTPAGHALKL